MSLLPPFSFRFQTIQNFLFTNQNPGWGVFLISGVRRPRSCPLEIPWQPRYSTKHFPSLPPHPPQQPQLLHQYLTASLHNGMQSLYMDSYLGFWLCCWLFLGHTWPSLLWKNIANMKPGNVSWDPPSEKRNMLIICRCDEWCRARDWCAKFWLGGPEGWACWSELTRPSRRQVKREKKNILTRRTHLQEGYTCQKDIM